MPMGPSLSLQSGSLSPYLGTHYLHSMDSLVWVSDSRYESVQGNYNALYENLYEAIRVDKSKLIVKPEQAVQVLRIIEMGQKAAKQERLVSSKE